MFRLVIVGLFAFVLSNGYSLQGQVCKDFAGHLGRILKLDTSGLLELEAHQRKPAPDLSNIRSHFVHKDAQVLRDSEALRRQLDRLETEATRLGAQLRLPNRQREWNFRDTRGFWTALREGADQNPGLIRLQDQVRQNTLETRSKKEKLRTNSEVLRPAYEAAFDMAAKIQSAFEEFNRVHRSRSVLEQEILIGLYEEFLKVLNEESAKDFDPTGFLSRLKTIGLSLETLNVHFAGDHRFGYLPHYLTSKFQARDLDDRKQVTAILGREMAFENNRRLVQMGRSRDMSVENFGGKFKVFDEASAAVVKTIPGRERDNGIYDTNALYLFAFGNDRKIKDKKLLERYREIDVMGRSLEKGFYIAEDAVVVLTRLSFEYSESAEALARELLNIYRTLKDRIPSMKLADIEAAALMEIRRKHRVEIPEILTRFEKLFSEGRNRRQNYYINHEACLELLRLSYEFGEAGLVDLYFEIDQRIRKKFNGNYFKDVDVAIAVRLLRTHRIDTERFIEIFHTLFLWKGSHFGSDLDLILMMDVSLRAKAMVETNARLTMDEILAILHLPIYDLRTESDWFYSESSARVERRARSARSRSSSSSSSTQSDDDDTRGGRSRGYDPTDPIDNPMLIFNIASDGGVDGNLGTSF